MNVEEEIRKIKATQEQDAKLDIMFNGMVVMLSCRLDELESDIKCLRNERRPLLNKILG